MFKKWHKTNRIVAIIVMVIMLAATLSSCIPGFEMESSQPPYIGENGNWWVGDNDTGVKANGINGEKGDKGDKGDNGEKGDKGDDGLTPYIGENGNWWIGDTDTGMTATGTDGTNGTNGADGKDGLTPYIGENGNWWIGDADTGIKAAGTDGTNGTDGKDGADGADGADGKDGLTPFIGTNGNWWIGDADTGIKAAGTDGANGADGTNGTDGKDGADGKDGLTPFIGTNGNWWIGDADTGIKAAGTDGANGADGKDGEDGADGKDGADGEDGKDGADGLTPFIGTNGNWWIGDTDTGIKAAGTDGANGADGKDGEDGKDGADGADGKDGADGLTPFIGTNGNWWIGETDTGIKAAGTDGTNGTNGTDGKDGEDGKDGADGADGKDGEDGKDGLTPFIGTNGNWWIGTTDTGVKAEGSNGEPGVSILHVEINADGNLIVVLSNGDVFDLGKITSDGSATTGTPCTHKYSDWIAGEPATCESLGFNSRVCVHCGVLDYDFKPATGHVLSSAPFVLELPTATEDGMGIVSCTVCATTKMVTIDRNGDLDGDGLSNADEISVYHTDMCSADTDGDGLTDYEEIFTYTLDPLNADTDGDGANDGAEIKYGTDPKVAESAFKVDVVIDTPADTVRPGVQIDGITGDQLNSLEIEKIDYFEETTPGYMGQAYDYSIEGTVDATIVFEFEEPASTSPSAPADPTIYYYDPDTNSIYPQATTIVGDTASADVTQFGCYVLLDRRVYENQMSWVDQWMGGASGGYTDLEIVFVIDDSGSMTSNDRSNQRLSVAKTVIDSFGENAKAGIVHFSSTITALTGNNLVQCSSSGKTTLKNYLTTSYFRSSGLTYLYTAVKTAANLYSTPDADDATLRIMIVLSDGYPEGDSSTQTQAISAAQAKGIEVYTVGLGSNTSRFEQHLVPMSEQTGGKYQHSSNAAGLTELYDNIGMKIDMTVDSDGDGLPDYYEDHMNEIPGFSGIVTDKLNPDTDGDRLYDGEEVEVVYVYNGATLAESTKLTFYGKMNSDPTKADSDGDGVSDFKDDYPMDPSRS